MFASTRTETRRFFRETWRKRCAGQALEPLETLVAEVVAAHPEHHALLTADVPEAAFESDPAHNPFLHLGLHVALLEQLQADRPPGIRAEFVRLKALHPDAHETEHRILQILAEVLWSAQSHGQLPDEKAFLAKIRRLS
jgi:hypothetical protein